MGAVRDAAVNGRFPLALAPEGQVTYHNKTFGDLEAGTGRIAMWCRNDLQKAGRDEHVRILPLSLEYRYPDGGAHVLERVLEWISYKTGIEADFDPKAAAPREIHRGLLSLTEALLSRVEGIYETVFASPDGAAGPEPGGQREGGATTDAAGPEPGGPGRDPEALRARIERLCNRALHAGERTHGLPGGGSLLDRVFRLRDAGWRRMFRDDLPELSPLDRAVADAAAEQARLAARHMELVDVLEYVDPAYIGPESSIERFVEYALDLQDIVNRLLGGTIAGRMNVKGRRAIVTAGRPVSVDEFVGGGPGARPADDQARRGRSGELHPRDAASRITEYLRAEFTRLIHPDGE
jgi:hypothetical protein